MDIADLTATEMRDLIHRRRLSPVEVVAACLSRIDRYNGKIGAICTVSPRAMDDARAREISLMNGDDLGPLHGLPVGVKDVTPTARIRTTFGCPLYTDFVPDEDALVVSRLKKAGAIVLAKTNTPEFATGGNTFNEIFGYTRNPWNTELSAGGSTGGGAAALASGMIALAEGTDLGGSLRIPASFCGVVGLRPSPGLVPTAPSPILWDTLYVTGPMARTVEDMALMLDAISGHSPLSPWPQTRAGRNFASAAKMAIDGVKIAYCPDIAAIGLDAEIESVCRDAAADMSNAGARVEEVKLDLAFGCEAFLTLRGLWMVKQHLSRLHLIDRLGDNLAGNIEAGLKISTREIATAEIACRRMWEIFGDLFARFDCLLTPCISVPPFPVQENYPKTIAGKKMKTYIDWVAPTSLLSLVPLPAASVPCGLTKHRLPVGMQIVGRPQGEESVIAVGSALQKLRPVGLPPRSWD